MIDTLLLGLVGLSLLFGQLGRISLGNGIQLYALEILVLLHVLILLFRYATRLFPFRFGTSTITSSSRPPADSAGMEGSLDGACTEQSRSTRDDKYLETQPREVLSRGSNTNDQSLIDLRFLPTKGGQASINLAMTTIQKIVIVWFVYVITLYLFTAWGKDTTDNIKAAMYLARIALFAIYFYLLTLSHISRQFASKVLWIISIVVPAISLLQYVLIPDLRFLVQFGWDPHMYRAVGLIFDPPIVGVMLGVLLIVSLRTALPDDLDNEQNKYTNSLNRVKYYVPVLLNFLAVIFLYSRSTYIAVILSVFMFFILRKRFGYAMAWLVVVTTCIYLAPRTIPPYFVLESAKIERVSTVMSRKVEIQNGLRVWFDHPIFGIGYNRVAEYKKSLPTTYGAGVVSNHSSSAFHSFWLTQLATTGIVGFVLLVGVYMLSMKRSLYWALTLSIPALVGLIDNVVFHPFILTVFILIYFSKVLDTQNKSSFT